jgi:protein SCO1/2
MKTRTLINRRRALELLAMGGPVSLSAIGSLTLAACTGSGAPHFNGVDITGVEYARDFSLKDSDGIMRTLADFRGKVVVVFFGYTHCPDVCPTTLSDLAQVRQQLGTDADKLQTIFVTVDPERDRPDFLKGYMQPFGPRTVALVPMPAQLPLVAQDFKVYYKKVEGTGPDDYSMDHSASPYVYDPLGRLRLLERFGTPVPAMASDVKALLRT